MFIQKFQFHKGAIRTQSHGKYPRDKQKFQFHKGAIRTGAIDLRKVQVYISIP